MHACMSVCAKLSLLCDLLILSSPPHSFSPSQGAHSDGNLTKCVPTRGSALQDLFYILYCEDLMCLTISHFTV